jgi:N-acyl-D-amino-acid deacylase
MPAAECDLAIVNATVYDGGGAPPRAAGVAIRGDRIVAVGDLAGVVGARTLDARGLALAPGFIDVHSHDDFAVLLHPEMEFKVMQGVTSDVVGNCGFGAAPFPAAERMAETFHPGVRLAPWEGFAGYVRRLADAPPSLNVAVLVGHGTARLHVMGTARRAPSAAELAAMRAIVDDGLAAGALGLSTGLIYEPGRHAAAAEIVALASAMAGSGARYATHMRSEAGGLLDSIRESLQVGEAARVPVQISHHKAAGRDNWGRVRESLRLLEDARARGVDVAADQYPYTSASTTLAAVVQTGTLGAGGALGRVAAADVVVASAPGHREWEQQTLAAIANTLGVGAEEAARRILEAEGGRATVILDLMSEDDVRAVMAHPTTMIGSDGLPTLAGKPHPRLYGTFPRVLGRYARDAGVLSLADAVHRMTGLPAATFGLRDRGVVRPGAFADLVVFEPARVLDRATYDEPQRHPDGIVHVWVNGVAVVRDGTHTGARPGRVVARA